MYLVGDPVKKAQKSKRVKSRPDQTAQVALPVDESVIAVISSIVETACEHEPDLDLMRLINLLDLYRIYLQLVRNPESDTNAHITRRSSTDPMVKQKKSGDGDVISFERFVGDSQLLSMAASAASLESGEKVATPLPLTVSANV